MWQPCGFLGGDEAKLGEAPRFLTLAQREVLSSWWLAVREKANTPNWDIVSTCQTDEGPGLLLVEAKAHAGELHRDGKGPGNAENDARIRMATAAANDALKSEAEWGLCADRNYQLCNRFAWSWKLAALGIPTVLVYLGFLDADEMGKSAFASAQEWNSCLLEHAKGFVPENAWERRVLAGCSWFVPTVRSARITAALAAVTSDGLADREA